MVDVEQGEEATFLRDDPSERSSTGRGGITWPVGNGSTPSMESTRSAWLHP